MRLELMTMSLVSLHNNLTTERSWGKLKIALTGFELPAFGVVSDYSVN